MTTIKVSNYIADFLSQKNVEHIFGYTGGSILKIIESCLDTGKIEYIQSYHEQASSFAADAYARVGGHLGVAIATSGPGAINLIGGIANAYLDSIPCLFITGQDYVANINKPENVRLNGFQDLDIVSMVKPVTKYAVTIKDENKIRYELEKAYYLATSGRPGSVLIDLPIDIQFKEIDLESQIGFNPPEEKFELEKTTNLIELIKLSKRPIILAGGGVRISNSVEELRTFASKTGIPVISTLNGIDAYEDMFSFAGLHGNSYSNLAILNCDLLIVMGSRLGQRQVGKVKEKYTKADIVHIDIDKVEFGRAIEEKLSIYSDLKIFLNKFNSEISSEKLPQFNAWKDQIKLWVQKYENNVLINDTGIEPVELVKTIHNLLNDDAVMTADVGNNQMWVAQGIKIKRNQRLLNSTGLGAMGYSLPAAIGAKYAKPDCQVICFTGDGGLQMNLQELIFVGHKKLNIKIVVFNNGTLAMMREVQEKYYNSKYYGADAESFQCANLMLLAKAFDIDYIKVSKIEEVKELKSSFGNGRPCIIDVQIDKDAKIINRYDDFQKIKEDVLK